jgi:hypothetical protein
MGVKDAFVPNFAKDKLWKEMMQAKGQSTENETFFFTKIEAGHSHAVFMDS